MTPDAGGSAPNPFDGIADLYDWEHDSHRADIPLYLELARRARGPALELACGTGRVLIPLAREGIQATGVDSSTEMLERARQRVRAEGFDQRVELVQADMRTLDLGRQFVFAFVALDSFGLLVDRADQLRALECWRRHLVPTGALVIDVANGNLRGGDVQEQTTLERRETGPDGSSIAKWVHRRTSIAEQRDDLTIIYDRTSADGIVHRVTRELAMRYFTRIELELLLERAGFAVDSVFGDYDLTPFDDESDRLIAMVINPAGG